MSSLEALARRVRRGMAQTFQVSLSTGRSVRPWVGRDGLRIPRARDARREAWELGFLELLLGAYGVESTQVRVVQVPTALQRVEHANGVRSPARFGLYLRMLSAGEPVPPIFVERTGARWFIRDGNHRTHAAREAGVPFLVGLTPRRAQGRT